MRFNMIVPSMLAAGCLLLATSVIAAESGPLDLFAAAPAPGMTAARAAGRPSPASAQAAADGRLIMGIQRGLTLRGYHPGPVDGKMGPKTRAAIASYQEDHDMDANGAADQSLYDRLLAESSPPGEAKAAAESVIAGNKAAIAPSEPVAHAMQSAPAIVAVPAVERWHPYADGQSLSSVETAIVSFFDFMRDSALFLVGQFVEDDEEVAEEVTVVPASLAETGQIAARP